MDNIGIVLKILDKKAIVMSSQNDFIAIKYKPGMFVGQQVTFCDTDIIKPRSNLFRYSSIAAGTAAIFIFTLMYFQYFTVRSVYAFVDVDINPSLEFVINKQGVVLDIKAINDAAREVIKQTNLRNKPLKVAMSEIVSKCIEDGYLNPKKEKKMLISTSLNENSKEYADHRNIEQTNLDNIVSASKEYINELNQKDMTFYVIHVLPEKRLLAAKNNTSMGRYYIYERAKENDLNITIDEIAKDTVSQIVEKVSLGEDEKTVPSFNHENVEKDKDTDSANIPDKNGKADLENISEIKPTPGPVQTVKPMTTPEQTPTPSLSLSPKRDLEKGPGTPVLSASQEGDSGNYVVTMTMYGGNNGVSWKLYEDDRLVYTGDLADNTPKEQTASKAFTKKAQGTYLYRCELIDSSGAKSTSSIINVVVRGPGTPILSASQEGDSGNYVITMTMYGGNNGVLWKLYEDDRLVYTGDLVDNTPKEQTASKSFINKGQGTYLYRCELIDSNGCKSTSSIINVVVR